MPSYVKPLDQVLVAPRYRLGMDPGDHRYRAHGFFLPADRAVLEKITKEQLNDPLGSKPPVEFEVPPSLRPGGKMPLLVAFNRYGRGESDTEPQRGWLGYSEVFVAYLLWRWDLDADGKRTGVATACWHLPLVYIDGLGGSSFPYEVAILLGRECFGFAKAPGRIDYDPTELGGLPNGAALRVFDFDPTKGSLDLHPRAAITVEPSALPATPDVSGDPSGAARDRAEPEVFARRFLADATGLPLEARTPPEIDRELEERIGSPWSDGATGEPFALDLSGQGVDRWIANFTFDWLFYAPLIGLKQFQEPDDPKTACYQAVVQTVLERKDGLFWLPVQPYDLRFHPLHRVKEQHGGAELYQVLGLGGALDTVGFPSTYFWDAKLEYADPAPGKTVVWPAP